VTFQNDCTGSTAGGGFLPTSRRVTFAPAKRAISLSPSFVEFESRLADEVTKRILDIWKGIAHNLDNFIYWKIGLQQQNLFMDF
jgi:hypothetical protein